MASPVQIANMALAHVGASAITSITSPSNKRERLCALFFDEARLRTLRSGRWTCVSKRAEIALDATSPVWGFSNRYALPSDFVRLISIQNARGRVKWEIEGGFLYCDLEAPLGIKYVYDEPDTEKYDSILTTALSYSLAIDLVEQLTQSNTKQQNVTAMFEYWVAQAKKANAQEQSPQELQQGSWLDARASGG